MPLELPDVTLVLIETGIPELSKLALHDTFAQITPHDAIILTDDHEELPSPNPKIQTIRNKEHYNEILWQKIPPLVKTSHMLIIQWDGWVRDASMWTDEFLNFDYIGAVWPWHKENRVGNGGFSLRSTRLMNYLSDYLDPISDVGDYSFKPGILEDDTLCRRYRTTLETCGGFKWAPENLANQFSREHNWNLDQTAGRLPSTRSFGFHDCRNWPRILNPLQLHERLILCDENPIISAKPEYKILKAELEKLPQEGKR